MPKKTIIGSVVVFIVGVAVILALATSMRTSGQPDSPAASGTEQAQAQDVSSAEIPARPDCPDTQVAGVALPCLGGNEASAPSSAQYTIVSLWAWWCEPCRTELPFFDELQAKHPEYSVVGVHADQSAGNGAAMLNDLGVKIPSYQDDSNAFAGALGLPGVVPITVIVGPDGKMKSFIPKAFTTYDDLEAAIAQKIQGA